MKISLEEQNKIRQKLEKSNAILEENILLLHQVKSTADYLEQMAVCTKRACEARELLNEVMNLHSSC